MILGILAACLLALFASSATDQASAFAKKTPSPTPKATRVRTRQPKTTREPKKTATPEPAATPEPVGADDASDADDAEISPVSPGAMTSQILVFNPDPSGAATVQIDIYNAGGTVAYTTTETVNADGAKLITLPGSLGANFQGSAVISSDKNVQALGVAANSNKSARDAYEGTSAPATNLSLPFARHLAANTQNSILAVHNTTASSANVTITFYNPDGSQANQQNATLAAHQPLYLNTNTLFPSGTFIGSVDVTATQNVVAALQSLYYKDTAALRALAPSEQGSTVFLNFVERKLSGSGVPLNWSEIFVRNSGASATDVTLNLYNVTGALVGSQTATAVPVNGMAQFMLNDAAFASVGNNYVGWAKVTTTGETVGVAALDVISKGKRLTGVNGLANGQVASRYVCGDAARTTSMNSRLSILNTEARNAKVQIRLYDPTTGAKLVQTKIKLTPNAVKTVKLSDAAFAAAGTNFQGMAIVQAKGTTPPKIVVTANNPYGSSKLSGTTGYACGVIQ
ncbi:MAG: hypothetical protein HY741_17730 [Chloroflexi bacterium]|nr:hypothetical protein [Chloroflexota bacterium]